MTRFSTLETASASPTGPAPPRPKTPPLTPPLTAPQPGWRAALEAIEADHARLREERRGVSASRLRVLRDALLHKTFRTLVSYRLLRAARQARGPSRLLAGPAALWHRRTTMQAALEIAWQAEIGPGCRILHGFGIVVLPCARIGAGATLSHGAGIGARGRPGPDGRHRSPGIVEDGGFVGPYAFVWARMGAGGVLLAHSALTRPSPPGAVMGGHPAECIRMKGEAPPPAEAAPAEPPRPRSEPSL